MAAPQFTFQSYDQDDGLRNLAVNCFAEGSDGLLWVATENGLYRFDGRRFDEMWPADDGAAGDPAVYAVHADAKGRIWAVTERALQVLQGGTWRQIAAADGATLGERCGDLLPLEDGEALVVSDQGLLSARSGAPGASTLQPYFSAAAVMATPDLASPQSLARDHEGRLWLGCGERICERERNGTMRRFGAEEGVPSGQWNQLLLDSRNRLWARSADALVVREPDADRFTAIALPPSTAAGIAVLPAPLVEDRLGGIVTRIGDAEVARWDGRQWQQWDRRNGLPRYPLTAMAIDREGSLWLATSGHGPQRWLGFGLWSHWTVDSGLPDDQVWGMERDAAGDIWVATGQGLVRIAQPTGSVHPAPRLPDGPLHQIVGIARTADDAIWAVEYEGRLLRLAPGSRAAEIVATLDRPLRVAVDGHGRLIVVTRGGNYLIERPTAERQLQPLEGERYRGQRFRDIAIDRGGDAWLISADGIFRIDGRQMLPLTDAADRPILGYSSASFAPDGELWLGSFGDGLARLRIDAGRAVAREVVSLPQLNTRHLMFVRHDPRGQLWIGADSGVLRLGADGARRYTRGDGLIWDDCNEGAFLAEPDGAVWIGTSAGLSRFDAALDGRVGARLQALLMGARFGGRELQPGADNHIDWTVESLQLSFSAANFAAARHLRFAYRLLGLEDGAWTETAEREVRIAHVPPGAYALELVAINPLSGERSDPLRLSFTMAPPWWRTWWAWLLWTSLAGAIVWLAGWLRVRLLIAQRRRLERLVGERTCELEAEKRELLATREALIERATRDSLTGLWNRASILEILDRELTLARWKAQPLAVVLVDLDHFKAINDVRGHLAGDEVIRETARRLVAGVREEDFVGRYGGEEILMVMPELAPEQPCRRIEQVREAIGMHRFQTSAGDLPVTASFGVAWMSAERSDAASLLHAADQALYRAKAAGRNRVCYAPARDAPDDEAPLEIREPQASGWRERGA